jgi:hypothetical protein
MSSPTKSCAYGIYVYVILQFVVAFAPAVEMRFLRIKTGKSGEKTDAEEPGLPDGFFPDQKSQFGLFWRTLD